MSGREFEHVCVRRSGVGVYRSSSPGGDAYLRIGPGALRLELGVHALMLERGFPVPRILERGIWEGLEYAVEESLGRETLGDLYGDDFCDEQAVSEEAFGVLVEQARRFAHSQVAAAIPNSSDRTGDTARAEFAEVVGVRSAALQLPELREAIQVVYRAAVDALRPLPTSLVHGDFHVFNICEGGVIDLEGGGWGVAGYDVATAVFDAALSSPGAGVGPGRGGQRTTQRMAAYLAMLDDEFSAGGLPPPSMFLDAFLMCRAISLCAVRPRDSERWRSRQSCLETVMATFTAGDDVRAVVTGQ